MANTQGGDGSGVSKRNPEGDREGERGVLTLQLS